MGYKSQYIIFDLETGGLNPQKNPIMEIALIVVEPVELKEVNRWQTLVKGYNNLQYDKRALETHGITTADIKRGGVEIKDMVDILIKLFKECAPRGDRGGNRPVLVGHNTMFDVSFLQEAFRLCDKELKDYVMANNGLLRVKDTLSLAEFIWNDGEKRSYRLDSCAERAGLDPFSAHRAMDDVVVTWQLFKHFKDLLQKKKVVEVQTTEKRQLKKAIHEEPFEF